MNNDPSELYKVMPEELANRYIEIFNAFKTSYDVNAIKEIHAGIIKTSPDFIGSVGDYKFVADILLQFPVVFILRIYEFVKDMSQAENLDGAVATAMAYFIHNNYAGYVLGLAEQRYFNETERPEPTELE